MSKKQTPSLPLYRNLAVSFAALTLLLLGTILYFSIARATITIVSTLQSIPLNASVTVAAEKSGESDRVLQGTVFDREETKEEAFAATLVREEDTKAKGEIRIVNTHTASQALIATTRFLSEEGVLFRLKDSVTIPAGKEVRATIAADEPGQKGEIEPTRFTIPGLSESLQQKIYGISESPMTGGRLPVYRLSESDIATAREAILSKMKEDVRLSVIGGKGEESFVALTVEETGSSLSEKLGANVKTFTVKTTARVRGVVIPYADLLAWARGRLTATLPDDQRLLPLRADDLAVEVMAIDPEQKTARLRVDVRGRSMIRETSPTLDRKRFVGQTPDAVRTLLKAQNGITDVSIRFSPWFLKRLPRLPDHIRLEMKEQ